MKFTTPAKPGSSPETRANPVNMLFIFPDYGSFRWGARLARRYSSGEKSKFNWNRQRRHSAGTATAYCKSGQMPDIHALTVASTLNSARGKFYHAFAVGPVSPDKPLRRYSPRRPRRPSSPDLERSRKRFHKLMDVRVPVFQIEKIRLKVQLNMETVFFFYQKF